MAKFTLNFNTEFDQFLDDLSKQHGTTKSEIVRRALASYKFLGDSVRQKKGLKISVTTADDVVVKDIILP